MRSGRPEVPGHRVEQHRGRRNRPAELRVHCARRVDHRDRALLLALIETREISLADIRQRARLEARVDQRHDGCQRVRHRLRAPDPQDPAQERDANSWEGSPPPPTSLPPREPRRGPAPERAGLRDGIWQIGP